jgi:hypothetical protein
MISCGAGNIDIYPSMYPPRYPRQVMETRKIKSVPHPTIMAILAETSARAFAP